VKNNVSDTKIDVVKSEEEKQPVERKPVEQKSAEPKEQKNESHETIKDLKGYPLSDLYQYARRYGILVLRL